jgi:hypothetical protein
MPARVLVAIPLFLVIAAAALPATDAAQAPAAPEAAPATVALVETWSDGRVHYELTGPRRASMWTPRFPRVPGYQPPEGARPVYAVQIARALVGQDIRVEVSVLLGSAEPPGVPVATVLVSPGSRVVVDQLTRFGVQPLTLSMADVAPMTPFVPTVISVSADIEIADVEVHDAPYPGYRITLRNLGNQAVSNVHVRSYHGEKEAMSTLKRTDDGRPLMQPGATYSFAMNVTSGGASDVTTDGTLTPRPIDVIEVDSVRWADGTHHGTPPFPRMEPLVESRAGRQLQLRRIVEALRQTLTAPGSGPELLAAATNRIGSLPDAEPDQLEAAKAAMRSTRAVALAELTRLAHDHAPPADAGGIADRLKSMLARYEEWLTRLTPPR